MLSRTTCLFSSTLLDLDGDRPNKSRVSFPFCVKFIYSKKATQNSTKSPNFIQNFLVSSKKGFGYLVPSQNIWTLALLIVSQSSSSKLNAEYLS